MAAAKTPLKEEPRFDGGLQEIAPATFAWIQPNGGLGESNAGLIVGDNASLLIDTLWDERLTRRMLESMAPALVTAPIRRLLNTHGDGDHWYGNGLLPEAEIHASAAAAAQMREEPPTMLTRLSPLGPAAKLLGAVPTLPGRSSLQGIADFAEQLSNYDFKGISPRLPDQTFEGSSVFEAGGRTVEAIEVGPAHTAGDAIVWLADERIVFSGDIVFNRITPIMWAGPVENWIAALDRIVALDPVAVVPGHGPICGFETVAELRTYWTWLDAKVGPEAADDPLPVAESLVRSPEFSSAPWASWSHPERTLINVGLIARGKAGKGPIGTAMRIKLLGAMGALAKRLSR